MKTQLRPARTSSVSTFPGQINIIIGKKTHRPALKQQPQHEPQRFFMTQQQPLVPSGSAVQPNVLAQNVVQHFGKSYSTQDPDLLARIEGTEEGLRTQIETFARLRSLLSIRNSVAGTCKAGAMRRIGARLPDIKQAKTKGTKTRWTTKRGIRVEHRASNNAGKGRRGRTELGAYSELNFT